MEKKLVLAFGVVFVLLLLMAPATVSDVDAAVFIIPNTPSEFYLGATTEFNLVFYNFGSALDVYQVTAFFPWGAMYDLRPDTAKLTVPGGSSTVFTGTIFVSNIASLGSGTVNVQVHLKSPVDNLDSWVTFSDIITIEEPPTLETLIVYASGNPSSGNLPLEVELFATVFGGLPPYSYSWDFGDGDTSSEQNPEHTYTSAGTYFAKVTVTDVGYPTQTKSASTIIDVTLPGFYVSALANLTSGEVPLTVAFGTNISGGLPPYTYSWDFGDGGTSSSQSPSHTFTSTGVFDVQVSVTDSASQVVADSITINVTAVTVTATETFKATFVFSKPDGTALADTTIYYGATEGQETILLGRTDAAGEIISTDSSLANKTLYFKSSDGKYTARAFVASSGGLLELLLTEEASPVPVEEESFLVPALVVAAVIGVAAAGGIIAMKKIKAKKKPKPGD